MYVLWGVGSGGPRDGGERVEPTELYKITLNIELSGGAGLVTYHMTFNTKLGRPNPTKPQPPSPPPSPPKNPQKTTKTKTSIRCISSLRGTLLFSSAAARKVPVAFISTAALFVGPCRVNKEGNTNSWGFRRPPTAAAQAQFTGPGPGPGSSGTVWPRRGGGG